MGDENPIRTLRDYSKPSHEGYRNNIKLPEGNNADPNQHLKDFLKLVDSLELDVANRERMCLCLFQFSIRDKASNWLERLRAGSISTWEDLTTRFLAQFFPPGRTIKLHNDILMFQEHQGESLSEAWTRFKDLLQKVPHHSVDLWLQVQIFYDHVNPATRRTIDQLAGVKAIYLPQDVPRTSDCRLIELERLMEAHLALKQPVQVNKITSSCEIYSGPHDTQYCMENLEQAFVEYASSRTNEAGVLSARSYLTGVPQCSTRTHNLINTITICPKQPNKSRDDKSEEEGRKEEGNPKNINTTPPLPPDLSILFIIEKVCKLNSFLESSDLVPRTSDTKFVSTKDDGDVMFIEIIRKYDDSHEEGPKDEGNIEIEGLKEEYFDTFSTRRELAYHKYLMCGPIPSLFMRNPIITEGCPSNLKIPYNIRHVHVEKAYIDLNSPLNVMTRMLYN
ncbi:MAK10-like protein [Tanacetum coccineum]